MDILGGIFCQTFLKQREAADSEYFRMAAFDVIHFLLIEDSFSWYSSINFKYCKI